MQVAQTKTQNTVDSVALLAASLSAFEIGLGSVIHSLHIPFGGQFLSLNQGFLLARFVRANRFERGARTLPLHASNIAALLKSLSPAGKKLTPMLAISMQGFLFFLGTGLFGANFFGVLIGFVLLSLWAIVQGPLMMWLFFGGDLVRAVGHLLKGLGDVASLSSDTVWTVLGAFIALKVSLAALLTVVAYRLPDNLFIKYQERLFRRVAKKPMEPQVESQDGGDRILRGARLAARDLFNKWFFASLVLTVSFLVFSEASFVHILWICFRALAIGFVLFFIVRIFPFERICDKLKGTRFDGFARSMERTLTHLREIG